MFFFSSRRRHTRLQGDWSSDVCSSDLASPRVAPIAGQSPKTMLVVMASAAAKPSTRRSSCAGATPARLAGKIGRASCRERVEGAVGGETLEKTERRTEGERQDTQKRVD